MEDDNGYNGTLCAADDSYSFQDCIESFDFKQASKNNETV